jgi:DNA repair exonuclease SbcCD ATPase subunit
MINSIRATNIKGNTFNQELTGLDIFIGPNGSGKSTRIQSLQFAMLGYIPGRKLNSEVFKLSSGKEMTAGLQVDGFSFDRTFTRTEKLNADLTKDIKYPESLTVSPSKGEKSATQMNARVAVEVGNFPIVFDFQEFLKLSDVKRREFIYNLSPIINDNWDKNKISTHLTSHLLTKNLNDTNPELYNALKEMMLKCLNEWKEGYDLTSGLQTMLTWIELQQKEWNSKQADAIGAVRELEEMKHQLEETDRDISAKKNEIRNLREQHTDIHGQITAGKELKRQWDERIARIDVLKSEIESLKISLDTESGRDYESEVAELQGNIKLTDISEEAARISADITSSQLKRDGKVVAIDGLKTELSKNEQELNIITSVNKNIIDKGIGVCVLHHNIACDKDFSKFTDHVIANAPKLQETINDLKSKISMFEKEIIELRGEEAALEIERSSLYTNASTEQRDNDRIRFLIDKVRKDEQAEFQSKNEAQSSVVAKQAELDRLQTDKQPPSAPLHLLESQFSAIVGQISDLEYVIEEKEKAKITLSNRQTAMLSASKAKHYFDACKSLSSALGAKGIQGDLVKGIIGPIEDAINENLQLMGIHNPVFFSTESETGKEVFQFGWFKNGRRTSFDTISTGEQLMFLSAFLITMMERANPPVKVLAIDDINDLDDTNLPNVLNGLRALAHKVDNIIVAGVVNSSELLSISGWRVWDLSSGAEADPF